MNGSLSKLPTNPSICGLIRVVTKHIRIYTPYVHKNHTEENV